MAKVFGKRNNNICQKHRFLITSDIDTICDKQSRSIKTFENSWTENAFDKMTYKIYITRLVYYLNKYVNFCSIWSNEASNSSQHNVLSECHHLFYIFNSILQLRTAKLEKIRKNLIFQVYPIKTLNMWYWTICFCIPF